MRSLTLAVVLAALTASVAATEDTRVLVEVPAEVRTEFLARMRTHMDALKDVIQLASAGKIREAGSNAPNELAIGRALDIGNAIPPEFRAAGFDFQRAANDFADTAARASEPPDAADWPKLMNGLAKIATQCNACHAAFRIK